MSDPSRLSATLEEASARDEMRELLARYPGLTEAELERLSLLIKKARHIDVGMLSSDSGLGDRYRSFRSAETRRLRPAPIETARFLAFYLVPTAVIVWAVMEAK